MCVCVCVCVLGGYDLIQMFIRILIADIPFYPYSFTHLLRADKLKITLPEMVRVCCITVSSLNCA